MVTKIGPVCQLLINESESKGQIVSKCDLGLLKIYKLMYFDRNINGKKDGTFLEGNE